MLITAGSVLITAGSVPRIWHSFAGTQRPHRCGHSPKGAVVAKQQPIWVCFFFGLYRPIFKSHFRILFGNVLVKSLWTIHWSVKSSYARDQTRWQPDRIFICSRVGKVGATKFMLIRQWCSTRDVLRQGWGGVGPQRSCWYVIDVKLGMSYARMGWGGAIVFILMQRRCYIDVTFGARTVDTIWNLAKDMVLQQSKHWAKGKLTHCSWQMSNTGAMETSYVSQFFSTKRASKRMYKHTNGY